MIPPGSLRRLSDLDETSPQFLNQLSEFLRGNECRNAVPNLQNEDLVWLVEYLDSVGLQITFPLCAQPQGRFSPVIQTSRTSHFRNPYMNSEEYVAPTGFYRNLAHFQTRPRTFASGRLILKACMRGSSPDQGCGSNVYQCTLRETHRGSRRFVF